MRSERILQKIDLFLFARIPVGAQRANLGTDKSRNRSIIIGETGSRDNGRLMRRSECFFSPVVGSVAAQKPVETTDGHRKPVLHVHKIRVASGNKR